MAKAIKLQTCNLEILEDDNYETWQRRMKGILFVNGVWDHVNDKTKRPTGEDKANEQAEWEQIDGKANVLITMGLSRSQLSHVMDKETAAELWTAIESIHKPKGPTTQAALVRSLMRSKLDTKNNVQDFLSEFTKNAAKLQESGLKLEDKLKVYFLLETLPESFNMFRTAMESRDDLPTFEVMKGKIIEEATKQKGSDYEDSTGSQEAFISKGSDWKKKTYPKNKNRNEQKFLGKCFNCNKYGHRASECRNKIEPKGKSAKLDAFIATAYTAEKINSNEWLFDSGATSHMCIDRSKFLDLDLTVKSKIRTANPNAPTQCEGIGTVEINVKIGNTVKKVKLNDVLYTPSMEENLFSMTRILILGYQVHSTKNGDILIKKRGENDIKLKAELVGKSLIIRDVDKESAKIAISNTNDWATRWHRRMGHLNLHDMKKLMNKEMVNGIKFDGKIKELKCEVCDLAKITQQQYEKSETRSNDLLQLVHTDICGPMRTHSKGGARYFATFIDDKSRIIETVFLKYKSEIFQKFVDFQKRVERETGKLIKTLRCDNAKELCSKEFNNYLKKIGIKRQFSVEYTPQQNGVAERANRTLVEMARCLMIESSFKKNMWAELIKTATYTRNRCPTKILNDKTPHEIWYERKPDVRFMRMIGSKAIALKKGPHRGDKFDPKGEEFRLVGYCDESKAYRLVNMSNGNIERRRDVRFHENIQNGETSNSETSSTLVNSKNINVNDETTYSDNPTEKDSNEILAIPTNDDSDDNTSELEEFEINTVENIMPTNEQTVIKRRGPGRPSLEKTGKRGRPRKIYNELDEFARLAIGSAPSDPITVEEAMQRSDANEWNAAMKSEYESLQEKKTWGFDTDDRWSYTKYQSTGGANSRKRRNGSNIQTNRRNGSRNFYKGFNKN